MSSASCASEVCASAEGAFEVHAAPVGAHTSEAQLAELIAERRLGPFGGGREEAHGATGSDLGGAITQPRKADLVDARMLSPSVRSLRFRMADARPVGHVAGQYLDLARPHRAGPLVSAMVLGGVGARRLRTPRVRGGGHPRRGGPDLRGAARAGARRRRRGRGPCAARSCGATTTAAVRRCSSPPAPGCAPIRAMLAEEVKRPEGGPPLVLLFGCRTPADVLWGRRAGRLGARVRRASGCTSPCRGPRRSGPGSPATSSATRGPSADALPGPQAYVCGLSAMVDDVVVKARARRGHARGPRLRYETYD